MNNTGFSKGDILVPNVENMTAWSVIACDQYTSQPQYWREVEKFVGTKPSTLNMMVPEIDFTSTDLEQHIASVNRAMRTYLRRHLFSEVHDYIYTRRILSNGKVRCGLIGVIDLEQYEFNPGSRTTVRATEGVIQNLIEPRLNIRDVAPLEVSHTMLLIDDRENAVFAPLEQQTQQMQQLYSFDLMKDSGSISGYLVTPQQSEHIDRTLSSLANIDWMEEKYGITDKGILVYAVGDGNHSMATAKAYWEEVKKGLTAEEQENHPARFALVEVVNIHDESLIIEPIHRALFGVDADELLGALTDFYNGEGCKAYVADEAPKSENAHFFPFCSANKSGVFVVENPKWAIPVATIQTGLDAYLETHTSAKIDYIHGTDVVVSLAEKYKVPFLTYSAEMLNEVEEVSSASSFVKKITGIDNVCERAAVTYCKKHCEYFELIAGKSIETAMTAAIARRNI